MWPFYLSQQQKIPPKEMWISSKGLLATFTDLIKVSFSFLCTSRLIGRHMCRMAAECSWKYIICSLGWVNIAGRLVNPRDRLFWERKCCLSLHKKVFSSWMRPFLYLWNKEFPVLSLTHQKHVLVLKLPHLICTIHLIQAVFVVGQF